MSGRVSVFLGLCTTQADFETKQPLGVVLERSKEWAIVKLANPELSQVSVGSALASVNGKRPWLDCCTYVVLYTAFVLFCLFRWVGFCFVLLCFGAFVFMCLDCLFLFVLGWLMFRLAVLVGFYFVRVCVFLCCACASVNCCRELALPGL